MLDELGLLSNHRQALGGGIPQYRFYVSDMPGQFRQFANSIIKYGILASEKIDIHNYPAVPLSVKEPGQHPAKGQEQLSGSSEKESVMTSEKDSVKEASPPAGSMPEKGQD